MNHSPFRCHAATPTASSLAAADGHANARALLAGLLLVVLCVALPGCGRQEATPEPRSATPAADPASGAARGGSEAVDSHGHDHDHPTDDGPTGQRVAGTTPDGDRHDHAGSDDDHDHPADHDHDHDHDSAAPPDSTVIATAIAEASGIGVAAAGPSRLRRDHVVQGLLVPVEGESARVVARFPGPVRSVRAQTGDTVRAGQALAVVESNISLSSYTVTAPIGGTVLTRSVAVGDLAGDTPMFEIADLSALWVDLHLFGADGDRITPGLPVSIERLSDGQRSDSVIDRVLPGSATASQSTVARATLRNGDGRWRPGSAVRARVTLAERDVALAVPLSALQRFEGRDVVFVRTHGDDGRDRYSATAVQLGERDAERVEVLSGLRAGDEIVVEQSYLIKADIEKAGAAHEH